MTTELMGIPPSTELIATQIMDAAFIVHRELGPGCWRAFTKPASARNSEKAGFHFKHKLTSQYNTKANRWTLGCG